MPSNVSILPVNLNDLPPGPIAQTALVPGIRSAHLYALGNRQDAYHRLQTALASNRRSPDAPAMLHEMDLTFQQAVDRYYQLASGNNKEVTGRRLSYQAFALVPKIHDADELLRENNKARNIICEVHPELCFWGLNDEHPMKHNKKRLAGRRERLSILQECWLQTKAAMDDICGLFRRNQVAYDDIADAMVAAVTARARRHPLQRLPTEPPPPDDPPLDAEGLPMQMIWAAKGDIRFKSG